MAAIPMTTILVYLKNMAGEYLPIHIDPTQGIPGVCRALANAYPVTCPYQFIRIIRVETEEQKEHETSLYNGEVLNYFILEEEYYILNLTTGFYAVCYHDMDHNKIMKEFMTPLTKREVLLHEDYHMSRWLHTDKIVFVPSHLKTFVAHHYSRLV